MIEQNTDSATKNASSSRNLRSELSKSRCTLVKGPKPLLKFKFYLDIKNHGVTTKLETKIKSLGGVIELFLVEEVTHVITDREQCTAAAAAGVNSPLLRSVESLGSNESPHGSASGGSLRQKTRADAMLEKVRSQATNKCSDPLQNAKHWGIPIWTLNRVLSWLDKVTASVSVTVGTTKARRVKLISIKSPFLKYEPVTRDARPVYKSLQSWPIIDLESAAGKAAFTFKTNSDVPKSSTTDCKPAGKEELELDATNDSRMTRKQRTRLSVRNGNKEQEVEKQTLVGGFCEICHCEYREIGEHVRSEQHLNFVKNDANFLELDTLISAGANVEAFLRLNGSTGKDLNNYALFGRRSLRKLNGKNTPEKYNGSHEDYSPPVTRNKMPRTRTSSNHSPLSPTGSDSGHHLRSRGQLWLPPNLLGTTAEDEPFSNKAKDSSKHDRKSSCRLSEDDTKNTKENSSENGARPKRTCPKTKRISADERLVADNKTYYKVEVMTTKLRSSGLSNREHELARRAQTPIPEEPDTDDQGLVVKFKRVRRSELSVLNDEAENFMFPRKDDATLSDVDTDEAPNTTRSTIRSETSEIKSSEADVKSLLRSRQELPPADRLENSLNSTCNSQSETESVPRRRRTRNDTKLDLQDCEESNDTNLEAENTPARRRRTRADTKCETNELEEIDNGRKRTKNDTKTDPVDLEDSNDVESVENFENDRRRRTRNDTKVDAMDLDDSDGPSDSENLSKRYKRTAGKSDLETEDETRTVANCTRENSPTKKRRRAKSENIDVDDDLDLEMRRKRRKMETEMDETIIDESSVDCSTADEADGSARRKKRRTQAEAFIADNQRYYRFETPGSRLRYQGTCMQQAGKSNNKSDATNKSGCDSSDEREVVQVENDHRAKMPRDGLKFSFELLPKSEPWYWTFQRQDRGEEYYTCVSDPGYSNRFYLPYQFPYIIPLDPKVCIEEYKQKRESYIKAEAAKLDVTVDSPLQSVDSPAPSESVTDKSNESDKPLSEIQMIKRRRKRRFLKANSNHPRKSPRQHASTLAILSSLIQQRKKRERKSNTESDTSRASLASIPEENTLKTPVLLDESSQCLSETNNSGIDTALEEILTAPMDDLSDLDTDAGIVIKDKPDAIELLENYDKVVPVTNPRRDYHTPQPTETVRVVRRKRKKNRTGWPKKKRLFVKRSEVKSEDGNSSILELEDSRLTELSVEDESGELELCDSEECDRIDTNGEQANTGECLEETNKNKLNGTNHTGDILTCSSDSACNKSPIKCEQTNSEANEQCVTTDSEIQGVPQCTDRLNSVLVDNNSVQSDGSDTLVSVDNNNSVNSDIITVKVKHEGDDAIIIITNSGSTDELIKQEELDIKIKEEMLGSEISIDTVQPEIVPVHNVLETVPVHNVLDRETVSVHNVLEGETVPVHNVLDRESVSVHNALDRETLPVHNVLDREPARVHNALDLEPVRVHNALDLEPVRIHNTLDLEPVRVPNALDRETMPVHNALDRETLPLHNALERVTPDDVHKKVVLQDTASYPKVTVMDIRKLDIPCRKSQRNTSSDCSVVEEVIASQTDKLSACVHVALDKWENAEKVLHAKMTENETVPNEKLLQYQPFVRVQKIDNSTLALQNANRRLRSSSSPERKPKAKRAKIMPPSPRSPRKLRAPRGKWYRER